MATSIASHLPNCSDIARDVPVVKHGCRKDEKPYEESPTFSQISCETYNSRIESQSLNDYDSCSSVSELKDANFNKKSNIIDRDIDHTRASDRTRCSSSGMPVVRKSMVSTYLTGTESAPSDDEHGKASATAGDKITDLLGKWIFSESDELLQSRGSALDYSKFSGNNSKTSFQPERDDSQKFHRNNQTSMSNFQPQSQNTDYPQAKHSFNFNSRPIREKERKGDDENQSRTPILSKRNSNHTLNYTISELTLKLRGSMESDFLSSELRKQDTPKSTNTIRDSSENFRTIDEILGQYGFASNLPRSRYKNGAFNNVSQNNETLQHLETSDSGRKEETVSLRSRDVLTLPKPNMNSSASKESHTSSSSYRESKNAATSRAIYKSNLSQNNETKYGTAHQELLRKYGSSVDYSSIAAGGKYSVAAGSKNYGRYDYGKSTTLGDAASGNPAPYTKANFQDFEVKNSTLLSRQLEGSQVDILKPNDLPISSGDDYNTIRHTGSSTDAVEFTITNERQRLRRLDNMITSTSVTTSDSRAHKSLMTRYLSPHQDYEGLRANKIINKVYSNPTFPSSHYGTSLTPKGSWGGGVGQHDTSIILGKSASVPISWNNGFQSVTDYSSSVDIRSPYLPYYSNREYDRQYNNSTPRSFSLERLTSKINSSKNHAISLQNRKPEISLRGKAKRSILVPAQHSNYNHSRYPLEKTSYISMFSTNSDACCTTKSGPRKNAYMKQTASRNINDSKSASQIYAGLAMLNNRNKPTQGNQLTKTTVGKPGPKQRVSSASPHSSQSPGQVRKVDTFHNLAKELFKKDSSQTPSKSKHTSTGGHKANNPVGNSEKLRVRGSEVAPLRGQWYGQSSHTSNESSKRILRAVEKKKERISSEILMQKIVPKVTNKLRNHLSGITTGIYKPHSMMATSSRSNPQFSTRLPGFHGFLDHKYL